MVTRRYVGQSGRVYEPIEQIGPVGFGAVERVRDGDGNEYALKTLHLGFDPDVLAVEAENLSRVQHENVVGYVDHGTDPESFLVMELATGGTLTDYISAAQQKGELSRRDDHGVGQAATPGPSGDPRSAAAP